MERVESELGGTDGNMEGTKAELLILSLTFSETLLCADSHTSFAKKLYVLGTTALGSLYK